MRRQGDAAAVPRPGRREVAVLVLVLLAAAGLRLAYLAELRGDPTLAHPPVDAGFSLYWARGLATGDWTLPAEARGRDPEVRSSAFLRPPGYPYVLAGLYRVTGGAALPLRAAQMAGALLGLLLAWQLGRRLLGPAVGVTWAALLGSHWTLLYFEGGLHDAWLVVLGSLLLVALLRRFALHPGAGRAAAAAAALGGLALVRPNLLLAAPLLAVWGAAVARPLGARRLLGAGAAAALAGAAVLAPAALHNWRAEGALVPVSANAGITLYHGNNPAATGTSGAAAGAAGRFDSPWQIPDLVRSLSVEAGRPLTATEASRRLGREAVAWMRAHPGRAVSLAGRRALLLVGPHEIAHNQAVAADRAASPLLRRLPMPFALALAGGLTGAALLIRRGRRSGHDRLPPGAGATLAAVALLTVALLASYLPFFVTSLYRAPVIPWLLLGLAVAAVDAVRSLPARPRRAAAIVAAVTLGWLLLRVPLIPVDPAVDKRHVIRGQAWLAEDEPARAADEFRAAVSARSTSAAGHAGLGAALIGVGRPAAARSALERAVALDPGDPVTRFNLGIAAAQLDDWPAAAGAFAAAAADEPFNAAAHANLGIALERLGRRRGAAAAYARALELEPGHRQAGNNLAWLLATTPDPSLRDGARAVELAERLARTGADASLLDTLAAAYAEAGRFADAVVAAERARAAATPGSPLAAALAERLEGYRAGQPFRER